MKVANDSKTVCNSLGVVGRDESSKYDSTREIASLASIPNPLVPARQFLKSSFVSLEKHDRKLSKEPLSRFRVKTEKSY